MPSCQVNHDPWPLFFPFLEPSRHTQPKDSYSASPGGFCLWDKWINNLIFLSCRSYKTRLVLRKHTLLLMLTTSTTLASIPWCYSTCSTKHLFVCFIIHFPQCNVHYMQIRPVFLCYSESSRVNTQPVLSELTQVKSWMNEWVQPQLTGSYQKDNFSAHKKII